MIITFSKHALKRMSERSIPRGAVIEAISHPDKSHHEEDKIIAIKRTNGKVLLVIYKNQDSILFVITVVSSSKISKYLK
jgi:hypothetical protein